MKQPSAVRLPAVGILAAIVGFGLTVYGLGAYQAWWTIVFSIGGAAVFLTSLQRTGLVRSIAVGASITGALLLAGMSVFFLYGSQFARARPCDACADTTAMWLAAAGGSMLVAVLLALLSQRLMRRPTAA